MSTFANTLTPPYYAVIFTSLKIEEDNGYDKMAAHMIELAKKEWNANLPSYLEFKNI
jgi:hypothetical protein